MFFVTVIKNTTLLNHLSFSYKEVFDKSLGTNDNHILNCNRFQKVLLDMPWSITSTSRAVSDIFYEGLNTSQTDLVQNVGHSVVE